MSFCYLLFVLSLAHFSKWLCVSVVLCSIFAEAFFLKASVVRFCRILCILMSFWLKFKMNFVSILEIKINTWILMRSFHSSIVNLSYIQMLKRNGAKLIHTSIISPKPIPSHSNKHWRISLTHISSYKEMLQRKDIKDSPIFHTHSHTATIFVSKLIKKTNHFFQVLEEVSCVRLWA